MTDDELDHALRSAARPVPARAGQPRAQELLERIIRADREAVPKPHRRPRLVIAGATAALAAAGAVLIGVVAGDPAYASWTPDPGPLSAADARDIVAKCLPAREADVARTVIGETRGHYAYLNAVTPRASRTCFRDHNGEVSQASILTVLSSTKQLGRTGVELYTWSQLRTEEGSIRLMAGHLGSRITGVDITIRAGDGSSSRTARATVRDGYFVAWYPEGSDEANSNHTTLTLHVTDGRTINDLSASELYENPRFD